MPAWVSAGFDDYAKRLPREWAFDVTEVKSAPRDRGQPVQRLLAAESARIALACAGYRSIALDERGASWTTRNIADALRRAAGAGDNVAFVIGSADGLHADVRTRATAVVSLSAMTLPHGLARVVVVEQLYRAHTLLSGHPYHRD